MVYSSVKCCPGCGGKLKSIGTTKRIVRSKGGTVSWIFIRRLICCDCGKEHRELPDYLIPYKHYRADIINGVVEGRITSFNLDYEDYPCEMTMKRWKSLKN